MVVGLWLHVRFEVPMVVDGKTAVCSVKYEYWYLPTKLHDAKSQTTTIFCTFMFNSVTKFPFSCIYKIYDFVEADVT